MKALVLSLVVLSLAACAPKNAMLTGQAPDPVPTPTPAPPPPTPTPVAFKEISQSGAISATAAFQPKVDILFVVDNSDSMKPHQANLKKNVDNFVLAFNVNKRLNFQIGVVSIFDSQRYGSKVKDFYPLGKLQPVRDPRTGKAVANQTFVKRGDRYAEILGETLKIGTIARGTDANDLGGPEFEETFSPVAAAIDGRNEGFIRPEAHLAVIMITDADDLSSISPSELNQKLLDLKGQDASMITTFGVLALNGCKTDVGLGGKAPERILKFLSDSQGKAYNLCDPQFGANLAEAGRIIEKRASKRVRIPLEAIPAANSLKVTFSDDGKEIPGWQYDAERVEVVIPGDAANGKATNVGVSIKYLAIEDHHLDKGQAQPAIR